mgnify:CR=1 FL=1
MKTISTIICKPTKACNADCSYCSAPPDDNEMWTIEQFKFVFDKVSPYLTNQAHWIWHGGEPMLLGPDFYKEAFEYTNQTSTILHSMQTNVLLYDSSRWKSVFKDLFGGRISTSYDTLQKFRTIKGSVESYTRRFFEKVKQLDEDEIRLFVIGVYGKNTLEYAHKMYDLSSDRDLPFDIRINYKYPAGRNILSDDSISPEEYGQMLVEVYDRWIKDLPDFTVTPLNQMLSKCVGGNENRCPWTHSCTGRFLGIEPNGDVYNCSEFADLKREEFKFGNIFTDSMEDILTSEPFKKLAQRRVNLPADCMTCPHFTECEGGCMRDSVLFNNSINNKFHYCRSWKMIFSRMKESIASGEAAEAIKKYNLKY